MSRIGKQPIPVPKGVKVAIHGQQLTVNGPKGELTRKLHPLIGVEQSDGELRLTRSSEDRDARSLHGLSRALVNNMVVGVTDGHRRVLLVTGIGYRAEQLGSMVSLQVGLSHPVYLDPGNEIQLSIEGNKLIVTGIDKELVGDMAAKIRAIKPVRPYIFRGEFQGIRYEDERPRRKAGKQGV